MKGKVEGPGIFANFSTVPRQRKTVVPTSPLVEGRPGYARNLSSLNRIKKVDRAEPAPIMLNLELRSLATGQKSAIPVATMTTASGVESVTSPTKSNNDELGQLKDDTNHRIQETSNTYEAKQSTNNVTRSTGQPAVSESVPSDAPLMCWFWRMDRDCKYGDLCAFKHHPTGNPAPFKNELPKEQMTCRFWYNGNRCFKSADICRYAHYKTKYVASSGTEPVISLEPRLDDLIESRQSREDTSSLRSTGMTCWYWYNQTCNKTPEQCLFLHREMDCVVGRNGRSPTRIRPTHFSGQDRLENSNISNALTTSTVRLSEQKGIPDVLARIESPSPPPRSPREGQLSARIFPYVQFDSTTKSDQMKVPQVCVKHFSVS